ncbi:MAG: biotin/lipoyl-binding protein [Deltaproteobacteria bacterium]|nr:MAG: biotin/lipoyl-binding protein [Deltaproteobacteria bacterium]
MPAFSTILIANRGEIACRIARTARALGYRTVAVHSDADAGALHVRAADEAVRIGPAPAAESYLHVERILDAARRTGADAIHPGYGFLSENAAFAEACAAAGIVFVGPPPAAIRTMGDKTAAKAAARAAGAPCIPGDEGPFEDEADLLRRAEAVGYPLLVKAAAGGGGRGMRRVDDPSTLVEAVAAARREAEAAFGDPRIFLERAITGARHVEIQVLADTHGGAVHLGERDCSVQRRFQKVVEEAPSPAVDATLREAMGAAALAVARAVDYAGASTVEFLLADDGAFYFLEMNTRLQVEHPVTEMVYGVDLVAWQLRIAAGERLDPAAFASAPDGHAIEVRLYAEDPSAGFAPQAGDIVAFSVPEGPGLRCDAGVAAGSFVPMHYDPMIAKIVAHGRDRDEARRRLSAALRRTVVLGVRTNRSWLASVIEDPDFAQGRATCAFLDTFAPPPPSEASAVRAAAAALWIEGPDRRPADGWRNRGRAAAHLDLEADGERWPLDVIVEPEGTYVVRPRDEEAALRVRIAARGDVGRVEIDGIERTVASAWRGGTLFLQLGDRTHALRAAEFAGAADDADAGHEVRAPAAGRIVAVAVRAGDAVHEGRPAVTVESMKMETTLSIPIDGIVERVHVREGDAVAAGDRLVTVRPETEGIEETP